MKLSKVIILMKYKAGKRIIFHSCHILNLSTSTIGTICLSRVFRMSKSYSELVRLPQVNPNLFFIGPFRVILVATEPLGIYS